MQPQRGHAAGDFEEDTLARSLRMIEGFGVHSFRLIDTQGNPTFVKFHWRPKLGMQSTVWDETLKIAGADPDFHRRELFDVLSAGEVAEWEFAVQLFTQSDADKFSFNHLDATKLIPEELVPLQVIGRLVLDRWPTNFFAETEQVAFCPSHLVPGIDFSNDPLLQGRLFSYLDTQLSRLGSTNFAQIPINAPKCPFANQQRDGHMQMAQPAGRVAYEPSTLSPDAPRADQARGFVSVAVDEGGTRGRVRDASFADHYSQARQFWISQSEPEQAHLASALVFELSKVVHPQIREAMMAHLLVIDEALGQRVADGLGMETLPEPATPAQPMLDLPPSAALSIIDNAKNTLAGRCVAILVDNGSDGAVIAALVKAVETAGARVKLVAPKIGSVTLANGKKQAVDGQLAGTPSVLFDAVVLVLSDVAGKAMSREAAAVDFVRDAFGHLKAIAADAGAQAVLKAAGIKADEGVMGADDAKAFVAAASTRQWAREKSVRKLA